ncbi:Acyl-CoA N-acyltransferases (NAT) superfamily protein [Thalictrum thalictroides]|uniref:Acyl-CoA N-acyltransferases (NAT) superfamily protein n=1 Tax=Thalictrum thalictroides TaxID=46969 RepID=A0A7J6XBN8_THATH|nr:Acyl-CoA N-acyltransferases (NAT) superfamily protein [Thalictrum thalictroides]
MALFSSSFPSSSPSFLLNNSIGKTQKSRNFISFRFNFNIFKDRSLLNVKEAFSEDELWATAFWILITITLKHAAMIPIKCIYMLKPEINNLDHIKYLAEREFDALKERIAGKRIGFKRVSCINATVPLSQMSNSSDDLCSVCKYSDNGEDRIVIGSLDLNQCLRLPDEITGKRPEGLGSDIGRAYLSNVCVAKELQKNGVGSKVVAKSKIVAQEWGITDLYVHVAVDNEPARKLYLRSGFTYEDDEPSWQARFLDRPRRILLWTDVSGSL